MIKEAIENFASQFAYNPVIENQKNWQKFEKFLLVGMGGSHLQGGIMRMLKPSLDFMIHQDYGLPPYASKDRLVIVSSYSGNTEETVSAFKEAVEKGFPLAVSSVGGKLIELAKEHQVPYVQIPDTGIQPRSAIGYTLRALLKLTGEEELLRESSELAARLRPKEFEDAGKALAKRLFGKIPVVYSSRRNQPIAYNWKIKFNESAKIPAFYNVFPELNHNEMAGFSAKGGPASFNHLFCVILLKDTKDHPRIQKRMEVTEQLYRERGVQVETKELEGKSLPERIFSSLLLADWTAWYTAKEYRTEPEEVVMIEEFKKQIAK
ncbi:bifunctional phosphoglucose/phosphomannose isomerase [Patescibacteria group bacterium]|nr:bifunctional phosphoglucose/phosphomannose isomerase [Patescibacteria group bacterium]